MSSNPNPYRDPSSFSVVKIGGTEVAADLIAIDGNKIEDDWNVQKGTGTSGATAVYRGTKLIEGVKLTFEAPDEESFDGLWALWNLLAPSPVSGKQGLRPPTLSIDNPLLAWIGLTAISRKEWDGPKNVAGNSWKVDLTVIQSKPPVPAGTGAQGPTKSSNASKSDGGVDAQTAALQAQAKDLAAEAAAV